MMLASLDPRLRKVLALAILAALVSGTVNFGVLPFLDRWQRAQASLDDAEAWRVRMTAVVDRIPVLEQHLADLEAQAQERPGVLRTPNAALASAELQGVIQKLVTDAGVQMRSIQPLALQREPEVGAVRIGFRLRAEATENGLVTFLETIARNDPVLAVRQATIAGGYHAEDAPQIVELNLDLETLAVEGTE